jgi:hypothetical protein
LNATHGLSFAAMEQAFAPVGLTASDAITSAGPANLTWAVRSTIQPSPSSRSWFAFVKLVKAL